MTQVDTMLRRLAEESRRLADQMDLVADNMTPDTVRLVCAQIEKFGKVLLAMADASRTVADRVQDGGSIRVGETWVQRGGTRRVIVEEIVRVRSGEEGWTDVVRYDEEEWTSERTKLASVAEFREKFERAVP